MVRGCSRTFSLGVIDRPYPDRRQQFVLAGVHGRGGIGVLVVVAEQVQQTVDRIKQQLTARVMSARRRLADRLIDTHHDVAFQGVVRMNAQIKGKDIGRAAEAEILPVQSRHVPVIHGRDRDQGAIDTRLPDDTPEARYEIMAERRLRVIGVERQDHVTV